MMVVPFHVSITPRTHLPAMVARRMLRSRRRERLPYADDAPILKLLRPLSPDDEWDLAVARALKPRRGSPEPESFLRLFEPTEEPPHDLARARPGAHQE